jgi:PKHD-type hydroxylase
MTYAFTPGPDIAGELSHATWNNGFSNQELDTIVEVGLEKAAENGVRAEVGDRGRTKPVDEIRRSDLAWLAPGDVPWLHDRLAWIARDLNARFFGFDLYGFCEHVQFTTYRAEDGEGGHYDWHIDRGSSSRNGLPPRKLSMVLMLSDPNDYEGGELQIQIGPKPQILEPTRGIVHVFPSWVLHRVTPVTAGIRHTAVVWTGGAKFR